MTEDTRLTSPLKKFKNIRWYVFSGRTIKPPRDFIGTLKLALRSYLRDGAPSLELAAKIADLSTRTLQRRLADEQLSYRGLLDTVRYETAIDLMQNTDNTVTDIANLLGYTDPSHFARAFRRMAGVSPREYMQQT
jgi:AraC-like DNA-binding protein